MRDGNARVRGSGDAGGHARHDLEGHVRARQRLRLLTATPKHEWIPAFEPDDGFASARQMDEEGGDLVLPRG